MRTTRPGLDPTREQEIAFLRPDRRRRNPAARSRPVPVVVFFVSFLAAVFMRAPEPLSAEITFQVDESDSTLWFGTGSIALHFDRAMGLEVFWCEDGDSLSITAPLDDTGGRSSHYLTVGFKDVWEFPIGDYAADIELTPLSSPFFGEGWSLALRGRSASPALEKRLVVELFEDHPYAALTRTSYQNLEGTPQTILRWRENRFLLDLSRALPGWSPHGFLTVQPTIDSWGDNWLGVPLDPSFHRLNPLMAGEVLGRGGMPFMDLWGPPLGLALASLEPGPRSLCFPCRVVTDGRVEVAVEVRPAQSHGEFAVTVPPGGTVTGARTALILHQGDFYDGAYRYGRLLEAALAESGGDTMGPYPASAYHAYWKTWGYGPYFTVGDVYAHLDELADLGFDGVCLDDGWFDTYGGYNPDPAKFPGGEADLIALIDDLHTPRWGTSSESFETLLWWDVIGWEAGCGLSPDLLIRDETGGCPVDDRGHCYLCPAYPPAVAAVEAMVDKFMGDWGVDGLYMDGASLLGVPPCYEASHGHAYPAEACEKLPELFRAVRERAKSWNPEGVLVLCECSAPHDPYKMPFYNHEDASDPITDRMMRWKVKFIKAIRGPWAPVGDGYIDPMPFNQLSGTFAHTVGTGAVLTSMYTSLEGLGGDTWEEWTGLYQDQGSCYAEYLNLYDVGFESPEGHALRRDDGSMLFSFMNDLPWSGEIEIRGLETGVTYELIELDTGTYLGEAEGPQAAVWVNLRQQSPAGPYWLIIRAQPTGSGVPPLDGPASGRGGDAPELSVSPVPSAAGVTITFRLPPSGLDRGEEYTGSVPRLAVYDVKGRLVRRLGTPGGWQESRAAGGRGGLDWDGLDATGQPVASGVYLIRLSWRDVTTVARVLIAR